MTKTSLKGLLAAAAITVAGAAIAQSTPPNPAAKDPAVGAGQQSTQSTPMGATGTPNNAGGSSAMGASGSGSTSGSGTSGSGSTTGASSSGTSGSGSTASGTASGGSSTMAADSSSGRTRADRN